MSQLKSCALVAAASALICGNATAQNDQWSGNSSRNINDPLNWSLGVPGALESIKQTGDAAGPRDKVSEDWSRKVVVTMQGPRFLSLVATHEYVNCGGAHPDSDTMAMVFDITTGTPVSWPAMVTKSAGAAAILGAVSDGSKVGVLVLPALAKINLAAANEDCRDAFQDPQPFQLWPDAKNGALVAQAFDLPHVVAACAIEIPLSMAQARALGFDEGLLGAIEQAHRDRKSVV